MKTMRVQRSRDMEASPDTIYAIIADYNNGHPRILPDRYFDGLTVESGGVGAGTVIRFTVKLLGGRHQMRARVEEPKPGRLLLERNDGGNEGVTSFAVDPMTGRGTRVTITSEWKTSGLKAWFERLTVVPAIAKLLDAELEQLERVAAGG